MKLLLKFSLTSSIIKNQKFKLDQNELNQNMHFIGDPVIRWIRRYKNDPNITWLERIVKRRNFSFSFTAFTDIEQQLKDLNLKKVSQDTDILAKVLKEN